MDKSRNYVIICIPMSWPYIPSRFFSNFFKLVSYGMAAGYNINLIHGQLPFLDSCRDELFDRAMEGKPDYILCLDADQTYPFDTIKRLARHIDDGMLVVGGMTPHRTEGRAILFQWDENDEWKGQWSQSIGPNTGLVKVGGMGFGGVMLSPKIAEIIPFPRFDMIAHPRLHYKIGEDISFYKKCKEHGVDVWCDTSLLNGHLHLMNLGIQSDEKYSNDIPGFMGEKSLLWLYQMAGNFDSIVEIGSWKGRSTHALCSGCRGKVWAVDHFKGSVGEEEEHAEARDVDIYQEFIKNVGHFENLSPLKMSSLEAAGQFADKSVDMVFIDGGHTYDEVVADLTAWLPKCRRMICGHDYQTREQVKRAVHDSLGKVGAEGNFWFLWI